MERAPRGNSEASTATQWNDTSWQDRQSMDLEMVDAGTFVGETASERKFTVSIDFGTTFSSVSFVALPTSQPSHLFNPREIQSIVNYPSEPASELRERRREVPTESWYPNKARIEDSGKELVVDTSEERREDLFESIQEGEETIMDDIHMENIISDAEEQQDGQDSKEIFWGYEVQKELRLPDTNRNQTRRVARSKLLLDNSIHTQRIRDQLRPILKRLKYKRLIKKDEDVIADFLEHLFRHAKKELTASHGFSNACPLEFVLCVPAMWTQKACRTMQSVMETAIRKSGFGDVRHGSVDNLFIVSEPEAASAHVLADTDIVKLGETFVLIDAGGGTVDAITYTVDTHYPLRLKAEAVKPGGGLYGSSYLNEDFREHLLTRLVDETYLEVHGLTIESIVEKETIEFENGYKRGIDITSSTSLRRQIHISGLRANNAKRFVVNRLVIERADVLKIFLPRLRGVSELMREQLDLARNKQLIVKKVILIGGFASSPSLRNYLRQELTKLLSTYGAVRLIDPSTPETAVASGAVLRALNKENGPARRALSSYGFLRMEPYEPEVWEAHALINKGWHDPLDGQKYVKNTIDWLIKKDEEVPALKEYEIDVFHTFETKRNLPFICEEILYVSDTSTESHYRKSDPKNRGAEVAGEIVVDMTFLRTEGHVTPIVPEPWQKAKPHYKVAYKLVMIVDGRNMRYEARWAPEGQVPSVQKSGQISIAAAFVPGTN